MLRLVRQSPFAKGGWGLTYTNKTRESQVLLAGSTMNNFHEKGEYEWAIKQNIILLFWMCVESASQSLLLLLVSCKDAHVRDQIGSRYEQQCFQRLIVIVPKTFN